MLDNIEAGVGRPSMRQNFDKRLDKISIQILTSFGWNRTVDS